MVGSDSSGDSAGWQVRASAFEVDEIAPDGSEVRLLARLDRASMAQFRLPPGAVSEAVEHKTIEEYWYVASGRGQMWLKRGDEQTVVDLHPGLSLALAPRTSFQFRAQASEALLVVGTAVPAWPGDDEAVSVAGYWPTGSTEAAG